MQNQCHSDPIVCILVCQKYIGADLIYGTKVLYPCSISRDQEEVC